MRLDLAHIRIRLYLRTFLFNKTIKLLVFSCYRDVEKHSNCLGPCCALGWTDCYIMCRLKKLRIICITKISTSTSSGILFLSFLFILFLSLKLLLLRYVWMLLGKSCLRFSHCFRLSIRLNLVSHKFFFQFLVGPFTRALIRLLVRV